MSIHPDLRVPYPSYDSAFCYHQEVQEIVSDYRRSTVPDMLFSIVIPACYLLTSVRTALVGGGVGKTRHLFQKADFSMAAVLAFGIALTYLVLSP